VDFMPSNIFNKVIVDAAIANTPMAADTPAAEADDGRHSPPLPGILEQLRRYAESGLLAGELLEHDDPLPASIPEEQREDTYHQDLLKLFRRRLRLVTALAMMTLPIFAVLHVYLAQGLEQGDAQIILAIYMVLFIVCATMYILASRAATLAWARILSLLFYVLFSSGAALVVPLIAEKQGYLFSAHSHILISVLLLPYSVYECLAVGAIVIGSLAASGLWISTPQGGIPEALQLHLFVLGTTTLFVLCIAHFQSILRRRAFDARFDLVRSARQLQALSFLDSLTDGFNRRYLEKMANIEIARAVRFSRPLSLIMFDLDNFKQVNDTRGHPAGDEVLREVWQATLGAVREIDTAARYGGDEFAILLPEADEEAAQSIAERVQTAATSRFHNRFGPSSREGQVTLSIGIATMLLSEPVPAQKLIELADQRLYEAKRRGKNGIAY
jgi:diguanylate cyclase (GGDEF)-like protein